MSGIHINSLPRGSIHFKDHSGSMHEIEEVWFKNTYGQLFPVWPNQYYADDVVIIDLSENNKRIDYSVSNGEPVYTVGNTTMAGLLPNHNYVITGTIKYGDGSTMSPVTGCYFRHFTTQGSTSGCWTAVQTDYTTNQISGESDPYGIYSASSAITNALDIHAVLGYAIPAAGSGVVQLGFGDSYNFQNVTPIILRRISLSEECGLFDTNGVSVSTSNIDFRGSSSITLVPKTRTYNNAENYTSNWETHTNWVITNNTNWCSIVGNNDGSYTFTTDNSSPNTNTITFTSPEGTSLSLYFLYTGTNYRVKIGSDLNSSSMSLSGTESVTLQETSVANPTENDWVTSSESFTITSSDTSIVSVDNSNHTISALSPGSSTINVLVNSNAIRTVTVTVNQSSLYMHVVMNGTTYITTNPVSLGAGNTSQGPYDFSTSNYNTITFEFHSDYQGQSDVSGISTDNTDSDYSVPSGMLVSSGGNSITLVPQTTIGNYQIPVFWGNTKLGYVYGTVSNN